MSCFWDTTEKCQCLPTFSADDIFRARGQESWALKPDRFDGRFFFGNQVLLQADSAINYCSGIAICRPCKLNFELTSLPKDYT